METTNLSFDAPVAAAPASAVAAPLPSIASLQTEIAELERAIAAKELDNTRICAKAATLRNTIAKYELDIRTEVALTSEIAEKCDALERQSTDLLKSKFQMKQMRQMNNERLADLQRQGQASSAMTNTAEAAGQDKPPHSSSLFFRKKKKATALFSIKPKDNPELTRKLRELMELGTQRQAKEERLYEKRLQNQALRNQLLSNNENEDFDGNQDDAAACFFLADGFPDRQLEDSLD